MLNIELKPTGKEKEFEHQVVDLIKEYHVEDKCYVASQDYNVLVKTKEYDNSIKTIYVMSIAKGDIASIEYVDVYSIEASNINYSMVESIHNANKEIYAWTINDKNILNNMLDMHVDNIITNDPIMVKDYIKDYKNINKIDSIFEFVIGGIL